MGLLLPLFTRLVAIIRGYTGYLSRYPDKTAPSGTVDVAPAVQPEVETPGHSGWTTTTLHAESFEKVGRISMCPDGLLVYSDLEDRGFVLLNGDIGPVLDGDRRDVTLLDRKGQVAGKAGLSASGRALNIAIPPHYYTVPLRSVLAVLEGRNRKGAVFAGK